MRKIVVQQMTYYSKILRNLTEIRASDVDSDQTAVFVQDLRDLLF